MTDTNAHADALGEPGGLRDHFPGYFPPTDEDVKHFMVSGLISFDTNALFDLYRFNNQAREEYLASIRLLNDRLWVANQVGRELLERRLDVIKECSSATTKMLEDVGGPYKLIIEHIRAFGNRRGLSPSKMSELESLIEKSRADLFDAAAASFKFDLEVETSLRTDPILRQIESLLDGKVGPPLPNVEEERKEGLRRIAEKIPPGYADKKKSDNPIGDYLIWRQLLEEARRRNKSVLLVTNDHKEDWAREQHGKMLGPRPELVSEMLQRTGQKFHLVGVKSFLLHARKYLGATVSDATVKQAEQFTIDYEIVGKFMVRWAELETAIRDRIENDTGERPNNVLVSLSRYERLAGLDRVESAQLHNLRSFRNRLAHSTTFLPSDKEALEDTLALLEEHVERARRL
ncbi:PIN domain-containing protein [Nonomuraea sp. NPDC052265]|uniref:PIN domain-containing protein n=1 Tax=Nonomuraea sp. NPDC052265 TaxID=3364374 RepID=UPI0037C52830